jgi:hypothetical protein
MVPPKIQQILLLQPWASLSVGVRATTITKRIQMRSASPFQIG